jgi:hypothetical protein
MRLAATLETLVQSQHGAPFLGREMSECQHLAAFMRTQLDVIQKHLDEHRYLRKIADKEAAVASFVADYGWLIRELYCTRICEKREGCTIATELSSSGDLLRNHNK